MAINLASNEDNPDDNSAGQFRMTNTRRVAVPCMIDMIIFGVLCVRSTTHTAALHICYIRGHLRNDRFLAP